MEAEKGFAYLAVAVLVVLFAMRNKQWSWPLFGWVVLLTAVIGGGAVWGGIALASLVDPAGRGWGVAVTFAAIVVAVVVITFAAIGLSRRYPPPSM
jgi:hypothetical protein